MQHHLRAWIAAGTVLHALCATDASAAEHVDLGGVVISVSDSWTAQVFHIVDQLSEWDPATHKQYGRWAARSLAFDNEDRKLLAEHAALRRQRGWGNGFDQAFYVEDSIETAARKAVQTRLLSPAEAMAEMRILLHFAPKLSVLRDEGSDRIARFRERLLTQTRTFAPTIRMIARFSESKGIVTLPLFLVPNPEEGNGGGGVNGGRLVVEIQDQPDPLPYLFHECLHALLWPHKDRIEAAAKSAGLTFGALNEGIAYAFAPGLVDPVKDSDSLGEALVRSVLRGTPASDSYIQAYAVAVFIRPLLRATLERNETFTSFLPIAAEKWRTRRR